VAQLGDGWMASGHDTTFFAEVVPLG
jgi:hypothetical protein